MKKRTYIIGSGVSRELGIPTISNFRQELFNDGKLNLSSSLKNLHRYADENMTIEDLLSEIDKSIYSGNTFKIGKRKLSIVEIRKLRISLANAISKYFEKLHYDILKNTYRYSRIVDPFYYAARDC